MYSTDAKQVYIRLYEAAAEKLASVYVTPKDGRGEVQPNGTKTTKR